MNSKLLFHSLKLALLTSGVWAIAVTQVMAVPFTPPSDNSAPRQVSGGASRGNLQFVPPSENSAPRQGSGGASRIGGFIPPSDATAPHQSSGGASRTGGFTPPSDATSPNQSVGGASRGFEFIPPTDNPIPQSSSSGASRDGFNFIPPPDSVAPIVASGGSSREGLFVPAPDNAKPINAASGSSRTNLYGTSAEAFQSINESILAITPESFYGQTLEARPTILVYLPRSDAQQAIFRLKDESQNLIYEQLVPISEQAGIIMIQLPKTAPALAVNQNYQWFLTLQTEDHITPASPFVDAWIKRVEPSAELADNLMNVESAKAAEVLAQNGIWYDTVAIMADLRSLQSDVGTNEDWSELLISVGLDRVTEAPILTTINN
ncbi:protein of unknown function DUF928 [[Leptolyngbya] sp. PCC 7376]|uniref:DUF928 domain-containing protein n=1 Tax=[Leptolyngbya] sp. PCC 7376 TaxID=111781 RepID=UPI00029EE847|nr:DUF928 domain-containing protein [[Leptolyngbya] sp. PCC 7376]AFY40666.1 protein of unknown function DUF928 [[Leptolyngbya] sp. PCC 7376]